MSAYERVLDALSQHGSAVRANGVSAVAQCPAHEDRNPSLSLRRIEGSVLVHCNREPSCATDDVLAAIGLARRDLYDDPRGAHYDYVGAAGTVLRTVHRSPEKRFHQSGVTSGSASLYRLPQVVAAVAAGTTVHVVEGEADVHAVESLGAVATTSPMGAANAGRCDWSPLYGAHVVLVPDRDEAGQRYARDVVALLDGNARSVRLALAKSGKDAADHVAAGHGLDDLVPAELPPPNPADTAVETAASPPPLSRMRDGAAFVLDAPTHVPAVWGDGTDVVWASGESLILAGPPGVGKTTMLAQLVRARLGLAGAVLGWPVLPGARRVLYLAMDRPAQIARAVRRCFTESDRAVLAERLAVWPGPPPSDVAKHPDTLVGLAHLAGADTVVIDSMKDAAIGLTDDDVAAAYNRARQALLTDGVELVESHHLVKRGPGGAKPTTLPDVYGSMHLTAGAGSVVLLWGAAGDPIVELSHLKQPAGEVGPLRVIHDHERGTSEVWHGTDLLVVAGAAGSSGLTAKAAASAVFSTDKPTPAQTEKARRRLVALAQSGRLAEVAGYGQDPARWVGTGPHGDLTLTSRSEGGHGAHTTSRETASSQVSDLTGDLTHLTPPVTSRSTTPLGVEREHPVPPGESRELTEGCADCGQPLHGPPGSTCGCRTEHEGVTA